MEEELFNILTEVMGHTEAFVFAEEDLSPAQLGMKMALIYKLCESASDIVAIVEEDEFEDPEELLD